MSARLLIRLHADGQCSWLAQDAAGRVLSGAQPGTPPAPLLARAERVVALAPAEDVLLLDTPRLAVSRAQFVKAVPFALEDQLAAPVEELHFAVAERAAGERVPVAVVARARLTEWLARLAAAGVRADALYAETQALPVDERTGSVVLEDARALWRSAPAQAGVADPAGLAEWLDVINAGRAEALAFELHDFRAAASPPVLPGLSVRHHAGPRDALAFFAECLLAEPEPNLLQGEFAPRHRQAPAARLWRGAAALAAAALLLLFVYYGLDCWRLARQSARLEAAARAALHEAFPQMDQVAGDPRQLLESALAAQRGGGAGGLLPRLAEVAPLLASTTRTSLSGIEYHNGVLELALRAPDVQTLDLMRERMTTLPGLKVEVTAATSSAEGVDGRLRIAGGAP
jgi:general secretion pathway protein L